VLAERRSALSQNQREIFSARAIEHFFQQIELPKNSILALYWPIGDELDCRALIDELTAKGHRVCLPCIVADEKPLVFREFTGVENLVAAGFGTSEPNIKAGILQPDMIVLPLLGFDNKGNRLGYGKGFYDRTIAAMEKKPVLCAIAFATQEMKNIPAGPNDIPSEIIITENGQMVSDIQIASNQVNRIKS